MSLAWGSIQQMDEGSQLHRNLPAKEKFPEGSWGMMDARTFPLYV